MRLTIQDIQITDLPILKHFKCKNTSMEVFLADEAYYRQALGEGITKLVFEEESSELVGYYTLKCDKMEINDPEMFPESRFIPCVEISRIAVAEEWQNGAKGIHLGTELMKFIIDFISKNISKQVGCRYITLHAVSEKVKWYMEEFQFIKATKEMRNGDLKTVYMYLDISDDEKKEEYIKYRTQ